MKLLSGIVAATLTSVVALASANAADMYVPGPAAGGYKDTYAPAAVWTGFYAGVNGGFGWSDGKSEVAAAADDGGITAAAVKSFTREGGFGGGQIGYNFQGLINPHLVLGIEADIQGSGIGGSGTAIANADAGDVIATAHGSSDLDWFGTVRGRVGFALDRALVYGTGGFAYGGVKDRVSLTFDDRNDGGTISSASFSKDRVLTGFAAGGGVEYKFSPAWSAKAEYQFIDLGKTNPFGILASDKVDGGNAALAAEKVDHTYNTVRLGVNYHLLPGYEPLK